MLIRKYSILCFALLSSNIIYQSATQKCSDSDINLNYDLYPNYAKDWMYFCTEEGNQKVIFIDPTKDPIYKPDIIQTVLNLFLFSVMLITHNVAPTVHFYLYNKDGKRNGTKIHPTLSGIRNSRLDKSKYTVFLIHGYMGSYLVDHVQEIKDAYLVSNDYNIIIVDWGAIAKLYFYPIPMEAAKPIGKYVAKFIDAMIALGFDLDNIHVVGHSLGAHVAGFVGQSITEGKLARVTGFDPALPGYLTGIPTGGKISRDSAKFVDIIHTCRGLYGLFEPLGHADFYPNNGISPQPGCGSHALAGSDCSHGRSWKYFKESINNPALFPSINCIDFNAFLVKACLNNTIMMGQSAVNTARGHFYLFTNPTLPYGKGTIY